MPSSHSIQSAASGQRPISFKIEKKLNGKLGRAGILTTPNGTIQTPAFVTVGTKATVKGITPEMLADLGAQVALANTYHLYLQPGDEVIRDSGGLQKFMNWNGPTMTDSGGFQAFSLGAAYGKNITKFTKSGADPLLLEAQKNRGDENPAMSAAKIDPNGVMFKSIIDGSVHYFNPEKSIYIQHNIGADMIFAFDECTSPNEPYNYQAEALDRTHRWAKQSLEHHYSKAGSDQKIGGPERQAIFGIVQGGRHENLRKESAEVLTKMEVNGNTFDGFGIGGSFAKEDMSTAVEWVNGILPEEKPRHLLGIGEPEDLFSAVENGCDLFDCVMPTRSGRTGTLLTSNGKMNISNASFVTDFKPVEEDCKCYTCKNYTRAYLSHLFRAKEMLGGTLATIHNLYFTIHLVENMRKALLEDRFEEYKNKFLKQYLKSE
jgi:queuine tRNA-ribosyltransferase